MISVNIVAFNASATLARTLDSVLAQKNVSFEIVFVNDASTDDTLRIIEDYRNDHSGIPFSIITNPVNLGITKSRNIALKASNGSYIAVIDSDDTWTNSEKLMQQLAYLEQNPGCAVIGTQMRLLLGDGTEIKQTNFSTDDTEIRNKMLVSNQFCHSSILMRNTGSKYDESLYIWEDYDLLLNLGLQGNFSNINKSMVDYLYVPKKYSYEKKKKLISAEFEIICRYKIKYPNFRIGYFKRLLKYALVLLHLK